MRTLIGVERGEHRPLEAVGSFETDMRRYGFAAVQRGLMITRSAISTNRFGRSILKTVPRVVDPVPALKERMFSSSTR